MGRGGRPGAFCILSIIGWPTFFVAHFKTGSNRGDSFQFKAAPLRESIESPIPKNTEG